MGTSLPTTLCTCFTVAKGQREVQNSYMLIMYVLNNLPPQPCEANPLMRLVVSGVLARLLDCGEPNTYVVRYVK
jgi:hypothetical protein